MSTTSIKNAKQQKKFFDAVAKGLSRYAAAAQARIAPATMYKWLRRGEYNLDHDIHDEYTTWYQELLAIESLVEERLIVDWLAQTAKDWRAAREYLKVRFPERFNVPTSASDDGDVVIVRDATPGNATPGDE